MVVSKKKRMRETALAYLFLLPSLIVLGIFVFWPVGFSFVLSFFKWDFRNMNTPYFHGLSNYLEIFRFDYPPKFSFITGFLFSLNYVAFSIIIILSIFAFVEFVKTKGKAFATYLAIILLSLLSYKALTVNTVWIASVLLWGFLAYELLKNKSAFRIRAFKSHIWISVAAIILLYVIFEMSVANEKSVFAFLIDAKDKNLFLKALVNTFYYVILTVPITLALALGLAVLLNSNVKFRIFFRTAYFIPFVTSVVAVSLVWKWIFNDEYGLLNYFLSWFNVDPIRWLKDEKWTIPTIAIVSIWKQLGYNSIIFLAGLQNIDQFYYEAAEVDGANVWQKFTKITWPLLSPTTFFLLIVSMIGAFKVFAQVYVLYEGLPGPYNNSGITMVYYVFDLFYRQQRMGLASAAAYLLFAVILVFTIIQYRVGNKVVEYVS
ncbi:sugar ABC transporter permease [Thermosipho ferrireducens]|uniref:Sugar ABC transporter permease n=1 Tax=Thermosipho ferrireducens TaxID=2571116 RepID=A0ABX7S655_9BACT|nr:sugar ABC transporter permease [Thermosipho ferrireducens]QTA37664.1 sugar ABC transporter permease [Thermosipho ferrireducens]